jgi:hypothetical protein
MKNCKEFEHLLYICKVYEYSEHFETTFILFPILASFQQACHLWTNVPGHMESSNIWRSKMR